MLATVQHKFLEQYILYSVSGAYIGKERTVEIIAEFLDLVEKYKCQKILVDLRKLDKIPPITELYELGEKAAQLWKYKLKVAIVTQPEAITGFFENVLVNRGAQSRVFPSFEEAEKWLLQN